MPVKNASIIATRARTVRLKANKKECHRNKEGIYWLSHIGMNSCNKAEIVDSTMAILFEIMNALNATFVLRIAEPASASWPDTKVPGMVIPAAKVTCICNECGHY